MNKEILFRGKRISDRKWIEGFYYKMSETTYVSKEDYEKNPVPTHHYILFERMTDWGMPNQMYQAEIDPETVCQYTGLTDKNGRKIFEGDICRDGDNIVRILWSYKHQWGVEISKTDNILSKGLIFPLWQYDNCKENGYRTLEVIGNIYDNPELLRGA